MNLTAGQYKGRKIDVPDNTAPTLSKVRQGVFNMLTQFELNDNSFLDMFSGSGLMGLEAISRGYKVKALEMNKKTAQVIKNNYKKLEIPCNLAIVDSLKYKTDEKYSIIYIDPPWSNDYSPILKKAFELKNDTGIIIIEYDKQRSLDPKALIGALGLPLEVIKIKKYGRSQVAILR